MRIFLVYVIVSCVGVGFLSSTLLRAQQETVVEQRASASLDDGKCQAIKPNVAVIYLLEQVDFKEMGLDLISAAKNNNIHGILLIVNNYGGTMDYFSMVHDLVKRIKKIKPIVCLVSGSALSGGYMVASAADYVIAHSCSEIGSIGVMQIIQKFKNPKVRGEIQADLVIDIFQKGEYKALFDNYSPELTDQDRSHIKEQIDKHYNQFLYMMAANRSLRVEDSKEWANGHIFIASEAVSLGLIDEIGTVFEAEQKLVDLIRNKNPKIIFDDNIESLFYGAQKEIPKQISVV